MISIDNFGGEQRWFPAHHKNEHLHRLCLGRRAGNANCVAEPNKAHTITPNRTHHGNNGAGLFIYAGLGDHTSIGQGHRSWQAQPAAGGV